MLLFFNGGRKQNKTAKSGQQKERSALLVVLGE